MKTATACKDGHEHGQYILFVETLNIMVESSLQQQNFGTRKALQKTNKQTDEYSTRSA